MAAVRVPTATDVRRCSRDAFARVHPLVDEAGALAEHARVPMRPSLLPRSLASLALAAALAASSPSALADPLYAPVPAVQPVASGAQTGGPGWARVHIVTQSPKVTLERRVGSLPGDPPPLPRSPYSDGEPQWERVCATPCDTALALGGDYRINGEDVTTSSPFALHGPATELRVDAGTYGVRRAGIYLLVIGAISAVAGGIFLGVNAIKPSSSALGVGGDASIAALAGGGALAIAGVGLVVGGGTSVSDETRKDLARTAPPLGLNATFQF